MCPYSKAPCDIILKSMLDIRKNIAELNVQKVNLLDERAEIEQTISKLEARLESDKQQETAYANRIQQLIAAYRQRDEIEQKLSEIVPDSDMDALVAAIAQYDQQAEALRVKLSHCIANKKYDETIDKFTNKKLTIQNHVDILNVWAKYTDANNLQTKVAMEPFAELEVKVDQYLTTLFHEDVKFRTELSTKANSFSFGIMRNNKYIPYELLSSGEKTLVAFSIMLYIASATTGALKLVMVDDMLDHLDSENVYTLFERLSEVEGIQIITAGVKEVTNQIHKINI